MTIGIDIRSLLDARLSGVPEYTRELLKELFRLDKNNRYVLFYNSARDLRPSLPDFDNPRVSVRSTRYPNKLFNNIMENLIGWPKIDRLLGADLFFMPNIGFAAFSPLCRSVLTVHDLSFLRFKEFFSGKRRVWHAALRLSAMVKKYDRIIAMSENTRQDLIELTGLDPRRVSVIYSGVRADFHPRSEAGEGAAMRLKYNLGGRFILFLGTLEPRKNISGLIAGFDSALTKYPDLAGYELVIAGGRGWKTGPIMAAREKAIKRAKIKFIGYVPDADRAKLYRACSLFVYPSFYEGFGLPPLEAMACGTPVIMSQTGSLPEVGGEGALLVNPHRGADIGEAIGTVLRDPGSREIMAARGISRAARYRWSEAAREHLKIFNSLSE